MIEAIKEARICAQCGSCASVCPFTNIDGFHIRRLVRKLHLGLIDNKLLAIYPWLCSQCSSCHDFCPENIDLPDVILKLKGEAIRRGLAPKSVYSIIDSILKHGNPYQQPPEKRGIWIGREYIAREKCKVAYWVGCTSSLRTRNIATSTLKILQASNMEFSVLDPALCCGEPLIKLGVIDEAREVAGKILSIIEDRRIETIVTSCAGCYSTFKHDYPNMLGIKLPVEILHTSQLIHKLVSEGVINPPETSKLKIAYHDPCNLKRLNLIDEPRKAIKTMKNVELLEPLLSRDKSRCCGGGAAVPAISYEASISVAYKRLSEDIIPLNINTIATSCPMCYIIFKTATLRYRIPINILDISELFNVQV
jgi:heterodisulfide reductase subunit D